TPDMATLLVRLRGWNTDGVTVFYLLEASAPKQVTMTKLAALPDLTTGGWHFQKAHTNDNAINFRDTGDVTGAKMGQYQKGNTVNFSGKVTNRCSIEDATDYWYRFDYNGKEAWIYGKYITFDTVVINEETLGLKPDTVPAAGAITGSSVAAGVSLSSMPYDVVSVYEKPDTLYNQFSNGDSLVQYPVLADWADGYDTKMYVKKGTDVLAELKPWFNGVYYSPEYDKLYFSSYVWDESYTMTCIDTKTGNRINLNGDREYYIRTQFIVPNNDGSKVLHLDDYWYGDDSRGIAFVVINVADNTQKRYTLKRYLMITAFGFLHDDVIWYISRDDEEIHLVKLEDDKAVPLSETYPHGDYDDYYYYTFPGFDCLFVKKNPYRGKESYIVGRDGSAVAGVVINGFWYGDQWYLATMEYDDSSCKSGTVRIYDRNFTEIRSIKASYDKYSWGTYLEKVGVKDGRLQIQFTREEK
ncbi:MAG: hypothetical protein MJ178_03950, partial [Treponemataceae bacterium]|nr:hypothetical protein [Treponemataceae bacterium]